MSKKNTRRTAEQRLAKRLVRQERGRGVFRYLTPEQAASPEFNQPPLAGSEKQPTPRQLHTEVLMGVATHEEFLEALSTLTYRPADLDQLTELTIEGVLTEEEVQGVLAVATVSETFDIPVENVNDPESIAKAMSQAQEIVNGKKS